MCFFFFFFQAEDGIRDTSVTGVQTCALPISSRWLDAVQPDVLCMQETKCTDDKFPADVFRERGYKCLTFGQQTRSEERRVGKECRSRWSPEHEKQKKKRRLYEEIILT